MGLAPTSARLGRRKKGRPRRPSTKRAPRTTDRCAPTVTQPRVSASGHTSRAPITRHRYYDLSITRSSLARCLTNAAAPHSVPHCVDRPRSSFLSFELQEATRSTPSLEDGFCPFLQACCDYTLKLSFRMCCDRLPFSQCRSKNTEAESPNHSAKIEEKIESVWYLNLLHFIRGRERCRENFQSFEI